MKVFSFFAESYKYSDVASNKAARVTRTPGKVRPQNIAIRKIIFKKISTSNSSYIIISEKANDKQMHKTFNEYISGIDD